MTSHDDNRGAGGGTRAPNDNKNNGIPDFTDRAREIADDYKCMGWFSIATALSDAYALGLSAGKEEMREAAAQCAERYQARAHKISASRSLSNYIRALGSLTKETGSS